MTRLHGAPLPRPSSSPIVLDPPTAPDTDTALSLQGSIRGDAKADTGQALSRLLNLTDGLLGQGRNVLVAITTNERFSALHPAVVRPGRSLANVEVSRFPRDEAVAWLGTGHPAASAVGPGGATLAELFALRDGGGPVTTATGAAPATGLYL